MKHFPVKRTLGAVLLCFCLTMTTSYASTTQKDIENTKDQITDLQNQKEKVENQVENLTDEIEGLRQDLSGLDAKMTSITASMNEQEQKIADKEAEIILAEEELAETEAERAQQYEDMKVRIQYMYENGNKTVWEMLVESESMTDFLNQTEYVTAINIYDRNMLVEYQKLQEEITAQKESLEEEKIELIAIQEQLQENQKSVNTLIAATRERLDESSRNAAEAQSDVEELETKIAKMIEYEKQLEIQKAREDAARLAAIRAEEEEDTSGVVYVAADSDDYLLGAIIECEAGGENYEGQIAVGSVIMNRVKSSYFPNTISGVIYQGGQFSPVASGRLAYRLEAGVSSSCLNAAREVLNGNITLNSLYFRTNNGIISGTVIGNHVFY